MSNGRIAIEIEGLLIEQGLKCSVCPLNLFRVDSCDDILPGVFSVESCLESIEAVIELQRIKGVATFPKTQHAKLRCVYCVLNDLG